MHEGFDYQFVVQFLKMGGHRTSIGANITYSPDFLTALLIPQTSIIFHRLFYQNAYRLDKDLMKPVKVKKKNFENLNYILMICIKNKDGLIYMIQQILINGRNATFSINDSNTTNLTIRLINELQITNFSTKIENSTSWYDSALAGVILGAVITFLLTYVLSWMERKNELRQYEYQLLSRTRMFLDFPETPKNEITSFINQIYLDPKLYEINSRNLITEALEKLTRRESFSSEKEQIKNRIGELRKRFKPKF